jgi:hypothetical protein
MKLGVDPGQGTPAVDGWIVDTSIESDHRRFHGFLKVSLEELLIALRDERHLLNDPDGLLSGKWIDTDAGTGTGTGTGTSEAVKETLYPTGFSAARFHEVIENEIVWNKLDQTNP